MPERQSRQRQSLQDQLAEQRRRNEHTHAEAMYRPGLADHRVLSMREWAALCGFSVDTGRRIIAAGDGPPLIQLSVRRIGIRLSDHIRWSDSRARAV
jgi:predicted DNA-binding transcriptional regulator AlpA